MSYSFSLKAASKAAAILAVGAKLDEIVAAQAVHSRDRAAILANAEAVIGLLADNDDKDVTVSCNGYLSWSSGTVDAPVINSASIACVANHAPRA